jgi:hypothetical protein
MMLSRLYRPKFLRFSRKADVITAVRGYIATWRARFWQGGWHPTQWDGYCDGVNGTILEVFVTDMRQQALAACERNAH